MRNGAIDVEERNDLLTVEFVVRIVSNRSSNKIRRVSVYIHITYIHVCMYVCTYVAALYNLVFVQRFSLKRDTYYAQRLISFIYNAIFYRIFLLHFILCVSTASPIAILMALLHR